MEVETVPFENAAKSIKSSREQQNDFTLDRPRARANFIAFNK